MNGCSESISDKPVLRPGGLADLAVLIDSSRSGSAILRQLTRMHASFTLSESGTLVVAASNSVIA
jgi:hypothetical protein